MDGKVTWKSNLSFTAATDAGLSLPLGASSAVGGEEDGFRPMQLLALGLAGCTAMDVISILGKKRQDVTSFEVKIHAEQAEEHPSVFTHAIIEYHVTGRGVEEAAVLRAIELSATRYCPAQAMLGKTMPIVLKYHIFEDVGDGEPAEGEPTPVVSGTYVHTSEQLQA